MKNNIILAIQKSYLEIKTKHSVENKGNLLEQILYQIHKVQRINNAELNNPPRKRIKLNL